MIEIKINGELVKELLEKHFDKKLKVTAVCVNNDQEVIKDSKDLDLYLEEIKEGDDDVKS